jgi:hypothetical protein
MAQFWPHANLPFGGGPIPAVKHVFEADFR